MKFNYFTGKDTERYKFIRISQVFFEEKIFANLSSDAKLVYAILLSRTALSLKNKWIDDKGRDYVIFTLKELMEKMNCSKMRATKILDELDSKNGIGLIERKRLGLGRPNLIYVKDFLNDEIKSLHFKGTYFILQRSKKWTSRSTKYLL